MAGPTHQGYSQIVWLDPERQVSGKQVSPPPHSSAISCCLGAYEEQDMLGGGGECGVPHLTVASICRDTGSPEQAG